MVRTNPHPPRNHQRRFGTPISKQYEEWGNCIWGDYGVYGGFLCCGCGIDECEEEEEGSRIEDLTEICCRDRQGKARRWEPGENTEGTNDFACILGVCLFLPPPNDCLSKEYLSLQQSIVCYKRNIVPMHLRNTKTTADENQ